MKKIAFQTYSKKMLADIYTPVGIYLRLRDKFRDTVLLESTDFRAAENSYSIIGINAIAGIEIKDEHSVETKYPGQEVVHHKLDGSSDVIKLLGGFVERFEADQPGSSPVNIARGLFGYMSFDAIGYIHKVEKEESIPGPFSIPVIRYRLYQYVIIINHFKDELYLCENVFHGLESRLAELESIIRNKDVPVFPFLKSGQEGSHTTDEAFMAMVDKGIASCKRGDSFQLVLSRRYCQAFTGDDFNVYRALRNINPSPYLFYFDYGEYRIMGSSPESQLMVSGGRATVHPIAGTFPRTGDEATDKKAAESLLIDPKENAEHVMLVDLARNDLSRVCQNVEVTAFKEVHYYSHVIHLVSEVTGMLDAQTSPFAALAACFPAGTLSGAPKHRALQLINETEGIKRGFYGGAIGFIGFDGSCNHAIMIRSFLSKNNTLVYQAGAGIVASSKPASELAEVNNKLAALKKAISMASTLHD